MNLGDPHTGGCRGGRLVGHGIESFPAGRR